MTDQSKKREISYGLPDFVIVGAGKCGTTAVWKELKVHPDLCGSTGKETNYFGSEYEFRDINWYRKQLKPRIARFIESWEPVLGVSIDQFGVRKMKTRWGSCNIGAKRIWLNLALIKYPEKYLEYVVVHEMIHLIERGHNQRFKSLMDRFVPNWRQLKKELNLIDL